MFSELKTYWNGRSLQTKVVRTAVLGALIVSLWLAPGLGPAVSATSQEPGAPARLRDHQPCRIFR